MFSKAALDYSKRGYPVIPIKKGEKRPALPEGWSRYCHEMPSQTDYLEWLISYEDYNIGLCCGPQSKIVCFDLDLDLGDASHNKIYEVIKDLIPESPVEKTGKKGFTRFFRFNGESSISIKTGKINVLDILSDKRQTVLPPSIHPDTGKPYRWTGKCSLLEISPDDLPVLDWSKIEEIRKRLGSLFLESNQKSTGRNNTLKAQVAAALIKDKSPEEIAHEILTYDNVHHNPPLFEDQNDPQMRGNAPEENALRFVFSNKKSIEDKLPKIREEAESQKVKKAGIMSLQELMALPIVEDPYLVDDLLPMGGTSVIAGRPKKGKSTLIRTLALSVATGKPFLDRSVKQGPVLYFALEEKKTLLGSIFNDMGAEGNEQIYLAFGDHNVDGPEELRVLIETLKPVLVIIDTLFRFVNVNDGNSYAEVTKRLGPYVTLATQTDTHIMFIHHTGKMDESVLGSTAIDGMVDTILFFKAESEKRTLSADLRSGQLEPLILAFDPKTKTYSAGVTKKEDVAQEKMSELLEALKADGGCYSQEEIKQKLFTGKGSILNEILKKLREDANPQIEVIGNGKSGSAYKYRFKPAPQVNSQFPSIDSGKREITPSGDDDGRGESWE